MSDPYLLKVRKHASGCEEVGQLVLTTDLDRMVLSDSHQHLPEGRSQHPSCLLRADSIRIGTECARSDALICRTASTPPVPGIMTSSIARSGTLSVIAETAAVPSGTTPTTCPSAASTILTISPMRASSSAKMILDIKLLRTAARAVPPPWGWKTASSFGSREPSPPYCSSRSDPKYRARTAESRSYGSARKTTPSDVASAVR